MKKILIFCILSVLSLKMAYAHNPLSAMYYLEVKNEIGILNVSVSQAGLQAALDKHYPNIKFDELTEVEYKKLAVNYLKENFFLKVNGNEIELLNGGLKLGNHQTDLKFLTSDLPDEFDSLDITIKAFSENDHHQSIFSLLLHGQSDKVILSENNKYSTSVVFDGNKMIAQKEKFNSNYLWLAAIVPLFILVKRYSGSKT